MKTFTIRKKDKQLEILISPLRKISNFVSQEVASLTGSSTREFNFDIAFDRETFFSMDTRRNRVCLHIKDMEELTPKTNENNWLVMTVLHEFGHGYFNISQSTKKVIPCILAEGLANFFALRMVDGLWARVGSAAWPIQYDYIKREKAWYLACFDDEETTFYPLLVTKFLYTKMKEDSFGTFLRYFGGKERTMSDFLNFVRKIEGEPALKEFGQLLNSFDRYSFGRHWKKIA